MGNVGASTYGGWCIQSQNILASAVFLTFLVQFVSRESQNFVEEQTKLRE